MDGRGRAKQEPEPRAMHGAIAEAGIRVFKRDLCVTFTLPRVGWEVYSGMCQADRLDSRLRGNDGRRFFSTDFFILLFQIQKTGLHRVRGAVAIQRAGQVALYLVACRTVILVTELDANPGCAVPL